MNVAIESPSLRTHIYEPRQRIKLEEIKKLSQLFIVGPLPDFMIPYGEQNHPIETRAYNRIDSTPSSSTVGANDSSNTPTTGRTSPGQTKKRAFSKIFNVFSNRSSSISSPSSQTHSEHSQTPTSPDAISALVRTSASSTKDNRTRSTVKTKAFFRTILRAFD